MCASNLNVDLLVCEDGHNSNGHVEQGNHDCDGLAHGARHDVRTDNRVSGRSAGKSRVIMHACVQQRRRPSGLET